MAILFTCINLCACGMSVADLSFSLFCDFTLMLLSDNVEIALKSKVVSKRLTVISLSLRSKIFNKK